MKLSKSANAITPSLSRELFNRAQCFDHVIDLTLGDPDMPPNEDVRYAACDAIMRGATRYSANAGIIELREAICEMTNAEYGVTYAPSSETIVTVGGMEALWLAFNCMLDAGDEVIVLAPCYVNYIQMIAMCGAVPVVVNASMETAFQPDLEAVRAAVSEKTVAIVVNSPNNPTGAVYSASVLDDLATLACEHDLVVISDEVYRTLRYDEMPFDSIVMRKGIKDRAVLVDSASKRFAMTGYRLGYALAPAEFIANMVKMQENVAACAPLPAQYAALEAILNHSGDLLIRAEFEQRRNRLCFELDKVEGLRFKRPGGTFYLFVDISQTGLDGMSFATRLLETEHVAVVPGITYGDAYSGFVRIAYTVEENRLVEAAARIRRFVSCLPIG